VIVPCWIHRLPWEAHSKPYSTAFCVTLGLCLSAEATPYCGVSGGFKESQMGSEKGLRRREG
jgi:hypothetical protein